MKLNSLRSRLLLGTTAAVTVVLALAGWTLYALVERSLVGEVDRALTARARLLASTVEQEGEFLVLEFAELDMQEFATPEGGSFLQLSLESGQPLYRSPSLGEDSLEHRAPTEEPGADWIRLPGGARGRVFSLGFLPKLDPEGPPAELRPLVLLLARDAGALLRDLATLGGLLILVGLATVAFSGGVLVWVIRRSLRPLGTISAQIATIGEDGLSTRLEVARVPAELLPVVQRVNGLLQRLEAAFARERAFSNEVAHELRTPLAGLRTTLEVTASRRRSEEEYAEALRAAAAIVEQLQSMGERLLQLARLDAGVTDVDPERFELADLALEAWEPFGAQAASRGLAVTWSLEDGLEVAANRELLGLILRNLFENAVTYADSGGQLRISARVDGADGATLRVANSGSWLGPQEAAAATQRFWRGDAARTQAGRHCGLGLALVERASEALGMGLELRSEPQGEFSVTLTLPGAGPCTGPDGVQGGGRRRGDRLRR